MALDIQFSSTDAALLAADVLVVGLLRGGIEKDRVFQSLDQALGGALSAQVAAAEFTGAKDQILDLPTLGRVQARRLVLLGAGERRELDAARVAVIAATAARLAAGAQSLGLALPDKVAGPLLRQIGEGLVLGAYRFTKYFTGERAPKQSLRAVSLLRPGVRVTATERRAVDLGTQVGAAVCVARDAVNEPPNTLTPEVLAETARTIAKKHKLKVTVLDKKGIAAAGMKLLYAVGQGSSNEPRFIHVVYTPKKKAKAKLAFVGKGLTFDSGGLCIKPAEGMGEMKSDMGGAAAVLGLMAAVAAVAPAVEVHGIIAAAENMPDGAAYRPGDVFGSLDGKTVEIINTDAEGRLVLADALTYATKLAPDLIIDAATLTGACVVALGKTCSAFYTPDDRIARDFARAADDAGESFWRMPLLDDQREKLKSDVADLKHTGDRWGGSISAAQFLREFTANRPWIHCDIAGPVLADRARGIHPKGATGHPVLTFLRYVESAG